jgi:hypothetical protein
MSACLSWLLSVFHKPVYNVWQQSLSGKAELNKAEYTRQIAALDAQAEVVKAQGVAQANAIVVNGLGGPEGYLRYLRIEKVAGSSNQVIYIPQTADYLCLRLDGCALLRHSREVRRLLPPPLGARHAP